MTPSLLSRVITFLATMGFGPGFGPGLGYHHGVAILAHNVKSVSFDYARTI